MGLVILIGSVICQGQVLGGRPETQESRALRARIPPRGRRTTKLKCSRSQVWGGLHKGGIGGKAEEPKELGDLEAADFSHENTPSRVSRS
jgi:hypothetical protein